MAIFKKREKKQKEKEKKQEAAKLGLIIQHIENLQGQEKLEKEADFAIKNAPAMVSDFFKLVKRHEDIIRSDENNEKRIADLQMVQQEMRNFFEKNKHPLPKKLNSKQKIPKIKNDPTAQVMLYFQAYALTKFNFDAQGNLKLRMQPREESEVIHQLAKAQLDKLSQVGFSPAFYLKAYLTDDEREQMKIYHEGAKQGSQDSKARVGQHYLSHITGNLINLKEPPYEFLAGSNRDKVLSDLIEAKRAGNINAISYVSNYISNVFSAIPALFQSEKVNEDQKSRMRDMGKLVMSISDDPKINKYMNDILQLENSQLEKKLEKAKEIGSIVNRYIENEFSRPFLITNEKTTKLYQTGQYDVSKNFLSAAPAAQTQTASQKPPVPQRSLPPIPQNQVASKESPMPQRPLPPIPQRQSASQKPSAPKYPLPPLPQKPSATSMLEKRTVPPVPNRPLPVVSQGKTDPRSVNQKSEQKSLLHQFKATFKARTSGNKSATNINESADQKNSSKKTLK